MNSDGKNYILNPHYQNDKNNKNDLEYFQNINISQTNTQNPEIIMDYDNRVITIPTYTMYRDYPYYFYNYPYYLNYPFIDDVWYGGGSGGSVFMPNNFYHHHNRFNHNDIHGHPNHFEHSYIRRNRSPGFSGSNIKSHSGKR
jgi:hypothetical protein